MRLYHPTLSPPGNTCEVPDQADSIAVLKGAGWQEIPATPDPPVGRGSEPVVFVPVNPTTGNPAAGTVEAALAFVDPDADERARLDDLNVEELREEARVAGVPVSGTKGELIDRLLDHNRPQNEEQ